MSIFVMLLLLCILDNQLSGTFQSFLSKKQTGADANDDEILPRDVMKFTEAQKVNLTQNMRKQLMGFLNSLISKLRANNI